MIRELTTWTSGGMRRITEDNSQYRKGWENTKSQQKR
jgi:hypothetical protein